MAQCCQLPFRCAPIDRTDTECLIGPFRAPSKIPIKNLRSTLGMDVNTGISCLFFTTKIYSLPTLYIFSFLLITFSLFDLEAPRTKSDTFIHTR